jgi:ParB family chromosome partitioning protein
VADKKPALGKGLSALIPEATTTTETARGPVEVDIDRLEANAYQPRKNYDETKLDELARSIAASGVIQPIVVRRLALSTAGAPARYQIIAGERRWRAAQKAGLHRVPVVVKDLAQGDRRQQLEIALVENIQREDLNPIEEAHAFQRLADEFDLRQEDIAARVGKDRTTVANLLRLLKLPEEVQAEVAGGALSMGHARAIVSLPAAEDQRRIARDVIARGLSVRETEAIVKRAAAPKPPDSPSRPTAQKDVHTRAAEEQLHLSLGTSVEIKRRGKGGVLEIAFANEEELQRLYEYLTER